MAEKNQTQGSTETQGETQQAEPGAAGWKAPRDTGAVGTKLKRTGARGDG